MKLLTILFEVIILFPLGSAFATNVDGKFVCTDDKVAEVDYLMNVHKTVQENVDFVGDTPETKQLAYDSLMKTELGELYRQTRECVLSFPGYTEDDLPVVEVPEFKTVAMIVLATGISTIVILSRNKINFQIRF